MTELTGKSTDLLTKIRQLLKTLEGVAEALHSTLGISTVLNHERDEFDWVMKNLEKINRRSKRTHQIDRPENFIIAQGWVKKMEDVHYDLVDFRTSIENIVSNWEDGQFVGTKADEIVTVDVTAKETFHTSVEKTGNAMMRNGTVSVNQ